METRNEMLNEFAEFLSTVKKRSPITINDHLLSLRVFFKYIYEKRNPGEIAPEELSYIDLEFINSITLEEIKAYMLFLQNDRNSSIATVANKIKAIRHLWRYLRSKGLISENITDYIEPIIIPRGVPKHLNLDECKLLLEQTKDSPRDYCIIMLFLNCALHMPELIGLNVEDIGTDRIIVGSPDGKRRWIQLTSSAKEAIKSWLDERAKYKPHNNALFVTNRGSRITNAVVQVVINNAAEKAGLSKGVSSKVLRSSAALLLSAQDDIDIYTLKKILGFKLVSTAAAYKEFAKKIKK